jgi:hypothetical protein
MPDGEAVDYLNRRTIEVSVTAVVVCVTCDMQAPPIGDLGHLGYPSLDDRATCHGELATFEHLYKGVAAIGYLPWPLEALRAFLVEHGQHDVGLFLEGEEYAGRFPRLTTGPSKTFEFADDNRFGRAGQKVIHSPLGK